MKRSLILTLLVAGCASPLPQTPPAGVPAQVTAPATRAGDAWSYSLHDGYTKIARGTLNYRVTAVGADGITVTVDHDGRQSTERYTPDWNWRERPMTNLQAFRYDPAYAALPFPLEAGKTWSTRVKATDPASGRVNNVRIDGKVVGWERVRVPAGEFDALKIQRIVYAGNAEHFLSEEKITEVDWYAPKVGRIVRHQSTSGHYDWRNGCGERFCDQWIRGEWNVLELVSPQAVSSAPAGR
jgi:hypothetical protein